MRKNKTKKREQYYEEVVRLHVEEGMSGRAISRVLPLGFPTVYRWLRNFAEEEGERNPSSRDMKKEQQGKPLGKSREESWEESREESRAEQGTESEEIEALKRELSKTKKELEEERLRSRFYDRMIDIAEEKFKIEIRKKAGAKQ